MFRMGTPRVYGGGELDPMSQVRVVEELSRIEGSVGWLSMISTAGSFLPAFLEPAAAQRLFGAGRERRRRSGSASSARGSGRGRLSIERDLSLRQRMPTRERHHVRLQHLRKWRAAPPRTAPRISRATGARVEGLDRRRMGYHRDARDRQQRHRARQRLRAVQRQHHDDGEAACAGTAVPIPAAVSGFARRRSARASRATRSTSSRRSDRTEER